MADVKLEEERIQLEKLEVGIDAKKAGVKLRADTRKEKEKNIIEASKVITELKKDI